MIHRLHCSSHAINLHFHSSVSLPLPASGHQSICHETLSIYHSQANSTTTSITPNPSKDLPLSNKADVEPSVPLCHD
jgi:hypothetical protein